MFVNGPRNIFALTTEKGNVFNFQSIFLLFNVHLSIECNPVLLRSNTMMIYKIIDIVRALNGQLASLDESIETHL